MLGRDFGLVGTVTQKIDNRDVRLTIKGGGLGAPLERWLKKDEVFAVVQMHAAGAGMRGNRVPFALLQVKEPPRDGICVCRLFNRYQDPLGERGGVVGVRALKLSTVQAPLRLRFVQKEARGGRLAAPPTLNIAVRRHGFDGQEPEMFQRATDADGFVDTGLTYQHC